MIAATALCTLLLTLIACTTPSTQTYKDKCIDSFDIFAYSWPDPTTPSLDTVLPLEPWLEIAVLPDMSQVPWPYNEFYVEAIRSSADSTEIWLATFDGKFHRAEEAMYYQIIVYQLEMGTWKFISAATGDPKIHVGKVFITEDGSIWGQNSWDFNSEEDEMPTLSRYNRKTEVFEIEQKSMVSTHRQGKRSGHPPDVLVYLDSLFWVFAHQDAIYTFNPDERKITRQINLPMIVWDIAPAPDGSIYFDTAPVWEHGIIIEEHKLRRFFPEKGEIITLEFPSKLWPPYWKMLVDSHDRLWLDAIGWQSSNGNWHRIYPNPFLYWFKIATNSKYAWKNPTAEILIQSIDKRLWFRKYDLKERSDTRGVAWYDPQTGDGCWITTEPAIVKEDQQGNLWMVAGGKLYKYLPQP
jgi:hypothetical protein